MGWLGVVEGGTGDDSEDPQDARVVREHHGRLWGPPGCSRPLLTPWEALEDHQDTSLREGTGLDLWEVVMLFRSAHGPHFTPPQAPLAQTTILATPREHTLIISLQPNLLEII